MHHTADGGKRAIERQMRRRIGRRAKIALDHLAGDKIDADHLFGFHRLIGDAGRLDDHDAACAVDCADVAPCEGDEVELWQLQVCFQYLLFE